MSPKGVKRPSAETGVTEVALKKRVVSNGIKEVIAALERADLPTSVIEALTGAAPHCLSLYADERHEFQANIIDMIGKCLDDIEASYKKAVQDASSTLAEFDLARLEAAIPVAARELAAKKGKEAEAEAEALVAKFFAKKADDERKEALKGEREGNLEVVEIEAHRDILSNLITEVVTPLRFREPSKKELHGIEAKLHELEIDPALLAGMEVALCKNPSERTDFDKTIIDTLDASLNEKLQELSAKLAAAAPGKEARAAIVANATVASEKAAAAASAAQKALDEAEAATEAAQNALKEAQHLVKDFIGSKRGAERRLEMKNNALADFQEGPLKAFQDLKARSTPVPEPEPVAEASALAEPSTIQE